MNRKWGFSQGPLLAGLILFAAGPAASEPPSEEKKLPPWHQTFPPTPEEHVRHYPSLRPVRTIQDVETIIQESRIDTVDELLARMRELDSEMFKSFGLVFWTKSLQEASYKAPRVLLRSRSGKFFLAFNGDKKQMGYDSVEMMEYDRETGRFIFKDLVFEKGEKPRPSNTNCAACHAYPYKDPLMNRPLLDPYPIWPRMYGGTVQSPKSEYELKEYNKFRKNAEKHPRYKLLDLRDLTASCDPNNSAALPRKPRLIRPGSGPIKPILKMHALIDSWNMDRVLKLLAKHPRYAELKPKLIEILEGQIKKRRGEEYSELKYSYQPSHDSSPFFDYEGAEHDEADIVSGNEFDGDAWDNLLCSIYENPPADIEAATPESRAFTRFLKEEFGFDLDHQGIALSRNDRMYKAGLRFIPDIFKRALDIVEPAPKSAKSAQPLWPPAPKLDAGLVLEANCASCHRKGNSVAAKYIPFHPLNRFKKVLNEKLAAQIEERLSTKNEDRRMPKYHPPLSEEEKAILLRYLRENVSKEKSGGRRIRTRMGYRSNL